MGRFAQLKVGEQFQIKGTVYKKTGPLTFEDGVGIEQYIQPIIDQQIEPLGAKTTSTEPAVDTRAFIVDEQTRVMSKNPDFGKPLPEPKAKKKTTSKKKSKKASSE
jgi:hypothetical protein